MFNTTDHWGRRYSYGVMAPARVPSFTKNPTQMQKGHLHFGCGADLIPRSFYFFNTLLILFNY